MASRDDSTPYILQAPASIAEKYGGNKQAIAQAARNGIIDPTAAVLAGMFIDKMRTAQVQEQAPEQTVAEKVLAPQQAPMPQQAGGAGLGGTPEAQMLAAAYPAEGAPPPIRTPEPKVPVKAAKGGLMSLDVPDDMYDYAGGGIVAFAKAGETGTSDERAALMRRAAEKFRNDPDKLRGVDRLSVDDLRALAGDAELPMAAPVEVPAVAQVTAPSAGMFAEGKAFEPAANPLFTGAIPTSAPATAAQEKPKAEQTPRPKLADYTKEYRELMPGESEDITALKEFYKGAPERLAKQKQEDLWTAVAMGGLGALAEGKPSTGNALKDALGALGTAGKYAMPQITEGIKNQRAGEEAAMKARAELAKMDRAEQLEAIKGGMALYGKELDRAAQIEAANVQAGKGTDMSRYVDNFIAARRAAGDDKTPDAILRQIGGESYLNLYGAAGARGAAALTQAGAAVTAAGTGVGKAGVDLGDKARDNVDNRLAKNYNDPDNKRIRELQKQDRENGKAGRQTNLAGDYLQSLYAKETSRLKSAAGEGGDGGVGGAGGAGGGKGMGGKGAGGNDPLGIR